MKETPLAYIPHDRLRALAQGNDLPANVHGVAMFADISGFTPLTEALARELGPQRGAEEITRHLNTVYDALIGEVLRYGGSVVGFSGDAITCWFDEDDGLRAAAAGLAMQHAIEQFATIRLPSGDSRKLALKVAAVTGTARRFVVGNPDIQLIDVLAGALMDRLADEEHHIERGEVALDEAIAFAIQHVAQFSEFRESETGERIAILKNMRESAPAREVAPLETNVLADSIARQWVLPSVHERLGEGRGEFLAELRPAVALFMRFVGIDYENDPDAHTKLDEFVRDAQRIAERLDGSLIQLTIGDKGSYLYIAFGAPHAHEDDVVRACSAALALRLLAAEHSALQPAQIGISRGRMRTGAYGSATQRTYGVQGDDVNLAARLMQAAAPGQILVSKTAQQTTGDVFLWESLPPIALKGKREPTPVSSLTGQRARRQAWQQSAQYDVPMVGREAEIAQLRDKLSAIATYRSGQAHGQVVAIVGEAGIGKSRLVSELVRIAHERGIACYDGECESYGANTGYLVWESVWRGIFGIDPDWDVDAQIGAAENYLAAVNPQLAQRLPLLEPLLKLPIPDNDLTRAFDAKLRKTSLESLLLDCLRFACNRAPMMIVLEDCHWLDSLSHDLLEVIARASAGLPVLIVLAMRPPDLARLNAPRVSTLPNYAEIRLTSFTREEAERLIVAKLQHFFAGRAAPPSLVERIVARAEGNPFYIEELLSFLHDRGVDPSDDDALAKLDLPASLYSLILARVDQLTESQRSTLRVASVVGRVFRANILWGAYPQLGTPQHVQLDLDATTRLDLTQADMDPELTYLFKHIVTQEVTYESLPFATRGMLHNLVGLFFEQSQPSAIDQNVYILALHFERSENLEKKRTYLLKAGEVSQANYANADAIDYFTRVMPLLDAPAQIRARRRLGQVFELTGKWNEARDSYEQAMSAAQTLSDRPAEAHCQTSLGELFRKRGDYDLAGTWLERAKASFDEIDDVGGVGQVLHFEGSMAAQRGDYAKAEALYRQSLAIRRRLDDKPNIASLLSNLGIVARYRVALDEARALQEEGLAIRRELGDRRAIAVSLNNLGNVALDQQDYSTARARLEEAVALQREVGDKAYIANALNNLGNVVRAQGDYEVARAHYRESLDICRELGERWNIAYLLEDIGGLAALEGKPERAFVLVGAASALREVIGAPRSANEQAKLDMLLAPAKRALESEVDQVLFVAEGKLLSMDEAIALARH